MYGPYSDQSVQQNFLDILLSFFDFLKMSSFQNEKLATQADQKWTPRWAWNEMLARKPHFGLIHIWCLGKLLKKLCPEISKLINKSRGKCHEGYFHKSWVLILDSTWFFSLPSDHCECKILEKSKERYHQRQVFEGLDWEDFGLWWTFHATEIIIAFRAKILHKIRNYMSLQKYL